MPKPRLDEAEHQQGRPVKLSKSQRDENEKVVRWAMAQQRAKAGRFLRVHLKISDAMRQQMQKQFDGRWNGYIDVVPDGSIGGRPDIDVVWQLFTSKRKSPRKTAKSHS